jgi:dGTPase
VSDLIAHSRKLIHQSGVVSVDDIRRFPGILTGFSPEVAVEQKQIREFLFRNLYYSPELRPEKEQAEQIISELFRYFLHFPDELPASHQEKMRQEPAYRIVCDYIAGMTDSYITEQHHRFCSPARRVAL